MKTILTIQQIQDTVTDYFKDKPVKTVYLFGSYARGEATLKSDVDLLLDLDYSKHIGWDFYRWWEVLEKKFKRKVDLVPVSVIYPKVKIGADRDKILLLDNTVHD